MKYKILIEILYMLLANKKVSAKQIAERFDISTRTVYRYITEIELANIPIIVDRGSFGGYYIADTFKLPTNFLTEKEFAKLNSVIDAFEGQFPEDDTLKSIRDKISCSTKVENKTNLCSNQLIIDSSQWFNSSSYSEKLSVISQAIDECQLLKISYHDRVGKSSKRQIEPHALALKQGVWYVYAYCRLRKDFRLFKIGRIEYATVCGNFERKVFDAKNLQFNDWKNDNLVDFEFEISPKIKSDIQEWLGVENVHVIKKGKIIATAKLPYDNGLVFEIMKYGSNVKVVKPQFVVEKITFEAQKLLETYK